VDGASFKFARKQPKLRRIRTLEPARSPNRIAGDTTLTLGQEDDGVGGVQHKIA
jgi:hypothetical protein